MSLGHDSISGQSISGSPAPAAAGGAFSADLTSPVFTFTPQTLTRLNDYIAFITTPVFTFTAQSITMLAEFTAQLTAPVFLFTAQALDVISAGAVVVNRRFKGLLTSVGKMLRQ